MNNKCDLCESIEALEEYVVIPKDEVITICSTCSSSISSPLNNEKHWNCLHDSMWSSNSAVQVVVYRLLTKLGWQDQLDMMYLEDENLQWAKEGLALEQKEPTKDSNGTVLSQGDSVTIIKDLVVKGASFNAKQGTTVKNIHIVPENSKEIEGKVNGSRIVISSKYVKKL